MDNTKIKKILIIIATVCLLITGCCLIKKSSDNTETDFTMYAKEMYINNRQLDSICAVDNLPKNLNEWSVYRFYDYETNEIIIKKMYAKDPSETMQIVYILTEETDSTYNIVIRTQKNEQDNNN